MSKFRRYAASFLTAATLATGAVALTPAAAQADPQSLKCAPTMPARIIKQGLWWTTWVSKAENVDTTYNEDNQVKNCQYEGRQYTENRFTDKITYHGTYRYWDIELVPIVWG